MSEISAESRHIKDRCIVDADAFDEWLAARQWSWQLLEQGEYGLSMEEAQLLYVCEDPVLWARAFLTEPDSGEPYNFFPYQQESVRAWDQDAAHQDGAEVGKTREITVLILWGMCTGFGYTIRNPSVLVGAPQQTHLDEIIMGIEAQVGVGEGADGQKPLIQTFWRKPKRTPHTMMRFKSPTCTQGQLGTVYFRPAGHDGEAFRGVHVNAMGLFDEAAKIKNPVCWSEFWRALKPGASRRVYSVPDGDNTTEYYRITQQAVPSLPPGEEGWRLFHWPKTIMPHPFWSEERDREFQRLFGGRDAPGYQRNVLGMHGQQENPVWPWALLESNIRDVPEYRVIKLRVDESRDEVDVQVTAHALHVNEGKKSSEERLLADTVQPLADWENKQERREAVRRLLREYLEPVDNAVLWAGADLGFSNDPTEIFICRELGHELRDLVRINAKGVTYDVQCELIYCLDELYGFQASWGVDFGSAGTAVVQMLTALEIYEDGNYDERLTGFNFSGAVDAVDEEGEPLMQENDKGEEKPVRLPAKELATNLITARFQRRGWALPYDNEVIGHFSNHTAREGAKHRIFAKKDDHTIDAKRVLMLRKAFNEDIGVADVFSSGVHRRVA